MPSAASISSGAGRPAFTQHSSSEWSTRPATSSVPATSGMPFWWSGTSVSSILRQLAS
jgi:hypothetical protein